jgi:hypothetical protein
VSQSTFLGASDFSGVGCACYFSNGSVAERCDNDGADVADLSSG